MMFGLGIRYLNGWSMAAADGVKKERAEWPPHPDRVFMAMAAAWFETDQDLLEKTALEWLERLPPPAITATDAEYRRDLRNRSPVTSFVPTNDAGLSKKIPNTGEIAKLKGAGLSLLPEHRSRQPRKFPVAIPHDPVVYLLWQDELPEEHATSVVNLCGKVVSIGHSASLVQMWVTNDPPAATLVPVEGAARHRLRVFGPGKLDYLKARCNRDDVLRYRDSTAQIQMLVQQRKSTEQERKSAAKGLKGKEKKEVEAPFKDAVKAIDESIAANQAVLDQFGGRVPNSLRPEPGLWQGYGPPLEQDTPDTPHSLFDPNLIVLSLSGKRLDLHSTLKLADTLRGAFFSAISDPIPEWVSGHRPDGSRSLDPHVAMLPLAFVQHAHADGRLMGVAFAMPRSLDKTEAGRIFEPWLRDEYGIPRSQKLFNGKWLECMLELETRESPPWNLRPDTWTRSSRLWASITPVVLDKHFSGKDKWEKAAEVVKLSCERIGLPRPEKVLLHPVSLVEGTPHAREFPPIRRKSDGGRMHHSHAVILFSEPVMGPVVVGAGRFRGYGFCRPMDPRGGHDD